MNPGTVAVIVNYGITVLAGILFTLYGHRMIGPCPGTNPRADEYHRRWGRFFRIAGPILIVGGILLAVTALLGNQ
jgi:hypothetical protein